MFYILLNIFCKNLDLSRENYKTIKNCNFYSREDLFSLEMQFVINTIQFFISYVGSPLPYTILPFVPT